MVQFRACTLQKYYKVTKRKMTGATFIVMGERRKM